MIYIKINKLQLNSISNLFKSNFKPFKKSKKIIFGFDCDYLPESFEYKLFVFIDKIKKDYNPNLKVIGIGEEKVFNNCLTTLMKLEKFYISPFSILGIGNTGDYINKEEIYESIDQLKNDKIKDILLNMEYNKLYLGEEFKDNKFLNVKNYNTIYTENDLNIKNFVYFDEINTSIFKYNIWKSVKDRWNKQIYLN